MEQIILSFDLSCQELGYDQAASLRKDISQRLNKALRDDGAGKWTGGACGLDNMEIFIQTQTTEKAVSVIEATLSGHWLCELMEIKYPGDREARPSGNSGNLP